MKVSVVLAIYNVDDYLGNCLESLAKQQAVDYEVIIVDDGSRKPIQKQLFPIADNRFHFFTIKHGGTALARNHGVSKSTGEIIVFVDGDMVFEPDFLYCLVKPIQEKLAKGTISTEEWVANYSNKWARFWNLEHGLPGKKRIDSKNTNLRDFRAILKSEFERVNGFDNTGYTDTWSLSKKLGYLPVKTKARYYHYNPSSLRQVYQQAVWIGGRTRKFGLLGKIITVMRSLPPVSLFNGIYKALSLQEPFYIMFKIVYDSGILTGVITNARIKP